MEEIAEKWVLYSLFLTLRLNPTRVKESLHISKPSESAKVGIQSSRSIIAHVQLLVVHAEVPSGG